ncbi:MAG TPA: bifunctional RNase H/acid phosphatase [Actinomycetes bacterium]|nr:bifunctional RNase H/acid phosphatase [Actinomycetes bacterium]
MTRFVVEADGGSRGNPGPAAYGSVVKASDGTVLREIAEHIGTASNNVAEYRGLIAGLEAVRELDAGASVEARLDSKLVVEQMSGRWKIKHPSMRELALRAREVLPPENVTYTWVPRERNKHADRLANEALDAAARGEPWSPGASTAELLAMDAEAADVSAPPRASLVGWDAGLGTPTTTLLLRHGQTAHTVEKRFSGSGGHDPELSAEGEMQVRAAAERLAADGAVDIVLASPLRRTLQTAQAVGDLLGLEVRVEDGFRECAFGEWEGLTFEQVRAGWPDELADWLGNPAVAPPGGESFVDVRKRVLRARDQVLARYPRGSVLVVTHVTPIKVLVADALEASLSALYRMELSPATLTEVQWFESGQASLRRFNDAAHLH